MAVVSEAVLRRMVVALADGVGHDERGAPFEVTAGVTWVASDALVGYPVRTRRLFGRGGERHLSGRLADMQGEGDTSPAATAAHPTVRPRRDFAAERPGVDLRLDATPRVRVVSEVSFVTGPGATSRHASDWVELD